MPRRKRFWFSLFAALGLTALCVAWLGGTAPRQAVPSPTLPKVALLPQSVPIQPYLPPIGSAKDRPLAPNSGGTRDKKSGAKRQAVPRRAIRLKPTVLKAQTPKPPRPKKPGKPGGKKAGDRPLTPNSGGTGKKSPVSQGVLAASHSKGGAAGAKPFAAMPISASPKHNAGKQNTGGKEGMAGKQNVAGKQNTGGKEGMASHAPTQATSSPSPALGRGAREARGEGLSGQQPGTAPQPVVDPAYENRPLVNPIDDVNHWNGHAPQMPSHQEPAIGLKPGGLLPKPAPVVWVGPPDRVIGSVSLRGTIPVGAPAPTKPPEFVGDGTGLLGAYYEGVDFRRLQFKRPERNIEYDWTGGSPDPRLPPGRAFSVMWHGSLVPRFSEAYTLYTASDDGVRVWIDGKMVIDDWSIHSAAEDSATLPLEANRAYDLRVEYFEKNGGSGEVIKLYWQSAHQPREFVPESQLKFPSDDAAVSGPPAAATP